MGTGPEDAREQERHTGEGLDRLLGLTMVRARADEVVATLEVGAQHHQPMGIVHGGVYCSIVETTCSFGAQLSASRHGRYVVGVDNHTSFLKAIRQGTLTATARPLSQGRRTELWEAQIVDQDDDLVATGRVRLLCLEPGKLAGQALEMKGVP